MGPAVSSDDIFQSTPSAWRETSDRLCFVWIMFISIHSLRMEGDTQMALYEMLG